MFTFYHCVSSFCRPSQPYAALGQQLQVLERPWWEEAAQPATASRVGAAVLGPGTLWSGAALLSPARASLSLPAQPATGPPCLHSSASVACWASTSPSIQKPQKDFLAGSCNWLVRWELWQTDTDTQHPYELLVPLRHPQCSLPSDTTERWS